jgi:hypothetical protein
VFKAYRGTSIVGCLVVYGARIGGVYEEEGAPRHGRYFYKREATLQDLRGLKLIEPIEGHRYGLASDVRISPEVIMWRAVFKTECIQIARAVMSVNPLVAGEERRSTRSSLPSVLTRPRPLADVANERQSRRSIPAEASRARRPEPRAAVAVDAD